MLNKCEKGAKMDQTDRELLGHLSENARASTSELARRLGLSRSTVQDRINRLEAKGIITGYTVRINPEVSQRQIRTHVMISVAPKEATAVGAALRKMRAVTSLYAIAGEYDLIAILTAETTEEIDAAIDAIGLIDGVGRTKSSIVLSTKFQR